MLRHLWIFDFDGTLSAIVPERDRAVPDPLCLTTIEELAALPGHVVAVLSNRTLDDLARRMPVTGIFLGGNGGMLWRTHEGRVIGPDEDAVTALQRTRTRVLPGLSEALRGFAVNVEDKTWSLAVHTRNTEPGRKDALVHEARRWAADNRLAIHPGPEVLEISLSAGGGKAQGIRTLIGILGIEVKGAALCYAGDDESDVSAMEFIIDHAGKVISVGQQALVEGSLVARDQRELCREIRQLAGLPPARRIREVNRS